MFLSTFRQRKKQIYEQKFELNCENKPVCGHKPSVMAKENLALTYTPAATYVFSIKVTEWNIKVVLRIAFGFLSPRRMY